MLCTCDISGLTRASDETVGAGAALKSEYEVSSSGPGGRCWIDSINMARRCHLRLRVN